MAKKSVEKLAQNQTEGMRQPVALEIVKVLYFAKVI